MGYTHYWTIGSPDNEAYGRLLIDTKKIFDTTDVPLAGWDGIGEPELSEGAIRFNGAAPDDYETFEIRHNQTGFTFCKTGERPYDAVVCAVLLRAQFHYGGEIKVSSDGTWDEWKPGRFLYLEAFGEEPPQPPEIN